MATGLEVWIAKPGSACRMDDGPWSITVFDAHNQPFEWAGMSYANLDAPNAHWAATIPPGTYVVRATNKKAGQQTDHAIVTVNCGQVACVHLFVAGSKRRPPVDHDCEIRIREVIGIGGAVPAVIEVTGTAAGCNQVKVTLTCTNQQAREMTVPVSASGHWTAQFKEVRKLNCRCGRPISVTAQCVENAACSDRFQSNELRCQEEASEPK